MALTKLTTRSQTVYVSRDKEDTWTSDRANTPSTLFMPSCLGIAIHYLFLEPVIDYFHLFPNAMAMLRNAPTEDKNTYWFLLGSLVIYLVTVMIVLRETLDDAMPSNMPYVNSRIFDVHLPESSEEDEDEDDIIIDGEKIDDEDFKKYHRQLRRIERVSKARAAKFRAAMSEMRATTFEIERRLSKEGEEAQEGEEARELTHRIRATRASRCQQSKERCRHASYCCEEVPLRRSSI